MFTCDGERCDQPLRTHCMYGYRLSWKVVVVMVVPCHSLLTTLQDWVEQTVLQDEEWMAQDKCDLYCSLGSTLGCYQRDTTVALQTTLKE